MTIETCGPLGLDGTCTHGSSNRNQIGAEVGDSPGTRTSLNDSNLRSLAGKPSGTISFHDFYGKGSQFNLTISANVTNICLRSYAVASGWNQSSPVKVTILSGVYVYSNCTSIPAMTVQGSWPGGVTLQNCGIIAGMGGKGGTAGAAASTGYFFPCGQNIGSGGNGYPGGPALKAQTAMTFKNNGTVGGGGGGGGGGNGFSGGYCYAYGTTGGGGRVNGGVGDKYNCPCYGGPQSSGCGTPGSLTTYGQGYTISPCVPVGSSGHGGCFGQSGQGGEGRTCGAGGQHVPSSGGAAGAAVVGNSYITYSPSGTLLGAIT